MSNKVTVEAQRTDPAQPTQGDQNQTTLTLTKRNSLLENNKLAGWVDGTLIKAMDKSAFARSMVIFSTLMFFLGNNLNIYLWIFMVVTIYMILLRIVRWWTKRWLLYLFEFCYFGIVTFIIYLAYYQHDKRLWCAAYVYSTGNMAIAIVVFNNQAQFGSTDHISSAWLHSTPIVTAWAIRWRDIIYNEITLKGLKFNLLSSAEMALTTNNDQFNYLVLNPLLFWCVWVIYYVIIFYILCNGYIEDSRYSSGLDDFVSMAKSLKFLGDPNHNRKFKYLMMHFCFFLIGIPFSVLSYNNFYFNTCYIFALLTFLMWNAGKQQAKFLDRKVKELLAEKSEKNEQA